MDIAKRFEENPLLRPQDLKPCIEGMEITCLLNPGVFSDERENMAITSCG